MSSKFEYMLVLIIGLISGGNSMANSVPDFPFVSSEGRAEIKVKPDIAKVTFVISEFSKNSNEAVTVVTGRAQAIVAFANKIGIEKDYITSTEYQKTTRRKEEENYQLLDILGYEVSQSFVIEIHDLSLYPAIVDQLVKSPNVGRLGSEFSISNEAEVDRNLVKLATVDAKRKATDLAEGMGVKLGRVFAISQDRSFVSVDAVFGIYPGAFNSPPDIEFKADYASSSMFIPKTIDLSKSVNVIFKIK